MLSTKKLISLIQCESDWISGAMQWLAIIHFTNLTTVRVLLGLFSSEIKLA